MNDDPKAPEQTPEEGVEVKIDVELHNEIVPLLTHAILNVGAADNGTASSLLVVESLAVSVLATCVEPEGFDEILDSLTTRIRKRLADYKLLTEDAAGSA